jgi:SAM-dependent methyltransferase
VAGTLEALELLWRRREPYLGLLAEIVRETLAELPPPEHGPLVEIGAGTGALRACLPPELRARTLHTDPSEAALHALRERAPEAKTRIAPAQSLPLDDGAAAAALGLCVFDALGDEVGAVAELGRVLAPGRRFFHFLDMATLLEAPFAKLAAGELIPLPNVFGDPAASAWPLDVILVRRDWVEGLLRWAAQARHPLAAAFSGFFGALLARPFDVAHATAVWKAVASNGESRRTLVTLLESAGQASFRAGHPAVEPLPFHSGRYLQSVLETAFAGGAFRVERSGIVTRAAWARGGAHRYRSLCLGHQRLTSEWPAHFLSEGAGARAALAAPDETLTELGVFVFVATRL